MTVSIGSQTSSHTNTTTRIQPPKSSRIRNDKALMWLYENLLMHQLKTKLECLLSDNEHLTNCYEVTLAFLGTMKFVESLYICLKAFDRKQYDILLQIDQNLYLSVINESLRQTNAITSVKMNSKGVPSGIRKISEANSEFRDIQNTTKLNLKKCDQSSLNLTNESTNRKCRNERSRCKLKHSINLKLRRFVSVPDLSKKTKLIARCLVRTRSQTIHTKSYRPKLTAENLAMKDRPKMSSRQVNSRKLTTHCSDLSIAVDDLRPINLVKCDDIKIYTDRRGVTSSNKTRKEFNVPEKSIGSVRGCNLLPYLNISHGSSADSNSPGKKLTSNSAPGDFASFFAANGAKIENRYQHNTLFDNIESRTSPSLCNHIQCALIPNRGQSLTSYLQEAQRTRRNITDLERENAHFSLSDVIISAIEEIKCSRMERQKEKQIKASVQTKKRKSHQRPLKNWNLGDDENCDRNNLNITDDDTASFISEEIATLYWTSSSGSDLSHISSSSDTSTASNTGDFRRLKVRQVFSMTFSKFNILSGYIIDSS